MGRVMLCSFRRPAISLTAAAALVLTVPLGAGQPVAGAAPAPATVTEPDLRLTAPPGEVVGSTTVRLGADRLHPARGGARTDRLSTTAYSMVGFTWRGADPEVALRTRTDGTWTPWRSAPLLTDGRASDGRSASSPLWVDRARGIQVRATSRTPKALTLVLINPGVLPGDSPGTGTGTGTGAAGTSTAPRSLTRATATSAPQPELHGRKEWGADPSWRNGKPVYSHRLKQIHVHHTATGNDYSRADVPGILRGMYRYHTQTLGWFDIGYNFLVDRFGRAWVGRSGGVNRLVRGAHTLGFNDNSVGIALIGNLQRRSAWPEAVSQVARLAAWKLDKYDRDAVGSVRVTSTGSDKYPDGTRVRLPVIDGHRDTNDTACPGRAYDKLPEIRRRAQRRIDHW
jgi:N-acetylmuramoyl-L-alanine amidase